MLVFWVKLLLLVPSAAWIVAPRTRVGAEKNMFFSLPASQSRTVLQKFPTTKTRLLHSDSSLSENEESEDGTQHGPAAKKDLERQKKDAEQALERIQALKNEILETPGAFMDDFQLQVDNLEQDVAKLESDLVPPKGLSMEEYKAALWVFLGLPFSVRWALCEALELQEPPKAASDINRIPEIVTQLYQKRNQLTTQRIEDASEMVKKRMILQRFTPTGVDDGNSQDQLAQTKKEGEPSMQSVRDLFLDGRTDDEIRVDNNVNNLLSRVTRKEGVEATKKDLDTLIQVLNKGIFTVTGTEKIPGGYIIRGSNKKKNGADLIQAIDSNLPSSYPSQASFMYDVSDVENAELLGGDPVLVLLNKDMSPRVTGFLASLCSLAAVISAFLFCVGVYGSNDTVLSQLSESQAVSDVDGVSWFTSKVFDVLLPMFAIQAAHEIGHFAVAKSKNMDTTLPTLLPFWSLPFMGAKTQLLTSPPNRNALFDFAVMGPLLGFAASLGCLALGLQMTATADTGSFQYFPAIPVSLIKTSTLGGTLVDFFLGGGLGGTYSRFVTTQDPATPISLHPLAVAGFASLLINSLSMLPLGSTDGGRMSLSIFGRYGHTFIGACVWFGILIASFTLERVDILIGSWLIFSIVQNDMEIPCRDEIEELSVPRILAAFSMWFITVLAIVPLS